jgi:predicted transcriptional regulator
MATLRSHTKKSTRLRIIYIALFFTSMEPDNLPHWREKPGFSQQALADYLGVSRSLVHLIKANAHCPIRLFNCLEQLYYSVDVSGKSLAPLPLSERNL